MSRLVRWTPTFVAALAAVVARVIAHVSLADAPHVMDEIAYVFQAKTYLGGHVTAPVALPRAAFALWFVDDRTSRYGIFPPGWPAVLALGIAVHLRAWVNPLLHGATTIVVARAARRLGSGPAAVLASLFYGLSPQALFLAASLMSHTVVAFGAALALWAGIAANGKSGRATIAIGGLGVAVALTARPLCGVVVFVGLAALLAVALQRKKIGPAQLFAGALPIAIGVALLLSYNHAVTGSALRFPQTVWFDEHAPPLDDAFFRYGPGCNSLGFGAGHGCDDGIKNATHDLSNALSNTGDNLTSWLFLAGGGPLSLGLPVLLLWLARKGTSFRFMLAVFATVPAATVLYALYWYAGTCFGARFYHAALPALLLLSALAVLQVERTTKKKDAARWIAVAWLVLSSPGFLFGLREIGDHYWGNDGRFEKVRAEWNHGPAVVMVAFQTDGLPMHYLRVTGFTSHSPHSVWHNSVRALGALIQDSPDPKEDRVVFVKFHPALVSELRDTFPSHALYMYLLADDPANDRVEAYRGSRWADSSLPAPRDNFDGYLAPHGEPP